METYLEAREPEVILFANVPVLLAVGVKFAFARARSRAVRAAGVSGPGSDGVVRPPGVTLPLDDAAAGVRVFLSDVEGVTRPEKEGVVRPPPPREEATEEGR